MHSRARTTADDDLPQGDPPRERLVTVTAVAAVAVAAVLAAVMHRPGDTHPVAPRLALAAAGVVQALPPQRAAVASPCAECGVIEAVVPIGPPAAEPGAAWQMRIRMDDGPRST